jgi:hypothetical protein
LGLDCQWPERVGVGTERTLGVSHTKRNLLSFDVTSILPSNDIVFKLCSEFSRPNFPSAAPKSFATGDQIHRARSPEAVSNLRKPGSGYQATDRSVKLEQPRRVLEEPRHLRDISLICPIRRIAGEPRCHSPLEAPTRRVKASKVIFISRQNSRIASGLRTLPFPLVISTKLRRSSSSRPLRRSISFLVRSNCCAVLVLRWIAFGI